MSCVKLQICCILFILTAVSSTGCTSDKLVYAVQTRDAAEVRRLLDKGANPNQVSVETNIMGPLLNPDMPLSRKTPVLMLAVQMQSVEIVEALLDAGADSNRTDYEGSSPLYDAASKISHGARITKLLLDHGADPNRLHDSYGGLPLYQALVGGTLETALILLPVTDEKWLTEELVRYSRQGSFGPIFSAVTDMFRRHELPMADNSLEAFPALNQAVLEHDADRIEQLLREHPESVDDRDRYGFTPLMWASSRFGSLEFVEQLLAAKADPNAKGDGQWTALYSAVEMSDADRIRVLCEAGANPNVSIRYQRERVTLLMEASVHCRAPAFQALLDGGADPLTRTSDGLTTLFHCAVGNRTEDKDEIRRIAHEAMGRTVPLEAPPE